MERQKVLTFVYKIPKASRTLLASVLGGLDSLVSLRYRDLARLCLGALLHVDFQ